ncbi:MAG: nitrogenase component 1 [Lachnospiraceae bacterium]
MKGLRKYLAPFAPDQSGASAVLSDLGGIIVICDAGGCAGNICGFDEPRWFMKKSAIFSAGLRDIDAILGRDDRLVEKLSDAAGKIDAKFAAIIGTPVPAVIGTDYQALKRMAEKRIDLPIMTVDTDGMELYDVGEEKTWLELFRTFAVEKLPVVKSSVGIIGATPLEIHSMNAPAEMEQALKARGCEQVFCYGMGAGIDEVKAASSVEKNLVIAPSGIKAARYLEERFGTPYEICYPGAGEIFRGKLGAQGLTMDDLIGKKILIMHQQVLANDIRREIGDKAECMVATWFMLKKELKSEGDLHLTEEDQFTELIRTEQYDVIIGDEILKNAVPGFEGIYLKLPHFAVSGKL